VLKRAPTAIGVLRHCFPRVHNHTRQFQHLSGNARLSNELDRLALEFNVTRSFQQRRKLVSSETGKWRQIIRAIHSRID
jgi:hypothetical protein